MIEIHLEINLKKPAYRSMDTLLKWVSISEARVLEFNSNSNFVKISTPLNYYNKMCKDVPFVGKEVSFLSGASFIESVKIVKIIGE